LTKGTLVTRFDYLKSSSNKVAILVDNDMYINPTFQELNTSFMDYLLMESLKNGQPVIMLIELIHLIKEIS
jgi:hypothetical protein